MWIDLEVERPNSFPQRAIGPFPRTCRWASGRELMVLSNKSIGFCPRGYGDVPVETCPWGNASISQSCSITLISDYRTLIIPITRRFRLLVLYHTWLFRFLSFSFFPPSLFRLNNCHWSFFKYTDSSAIVCLHPLNVFILDIVFSNLEFSFGSF